jgi:hypothetical protein
VETSEQPPKHDGQAEDGGGTQMPESSSSEQFADRAPYATRLRVVLSLSLLLWAIIALAIAWAVRHF